MSRGINRVFIIGNLGVDPEVRNLQNGSIIANLRVATSETWKEKGSNERQERTEWHKIVLFNKTAEIAGQYLKKGSKVFIEGSLRTNKWKDDKGIDRYTTEIIANNMQLMDSKGGGQMEFNEEGKESAKFPQVLTSPIMKVNQTDDYKNIERTVHKDVQWDDNDGIPF